VSIFVFSDFETRNIGGCALEKAGAWRYAADPATEIITLVYQTGGDDRHLWTPASGRCERLAALAVDSDVNFVCFAGFEQAIWQHVMVERFGFAPIAISRWIDVQAVCSYFALPRSLGKVLPVIGTSVVKDEAGKRLVRSLSRPNPRTRLYPEVTPEILQRVHQYNRIDVDGLIAIHTAVGELPSQERRVWELDQRINQRGLGIDLEFVRAAKTITEASTDALLPEFALLTSGLSPHQVSKTREWLAGRGLSLPDLQEGTVQDALDTLVLPDDVRRALEIRLIAASTSLKKLDSMLACAGPDGRARGLLQYHAATPGRWSGCLLQPQNLPRPTVEIKSKEIEILVTAVKTGDPGALLPWGAPIEVLASALRFAILARADAVFGAGDFSQIETCVLLALAGQHDKAALIAAGTDIYRDMAAQIYGLDRRTFLAIADEQLTLEQREQRQVGKNTILGCGYQMGAERFGRQYLRHLSKDDAKKLAEQIVYTHYRKNWAPAVPKLWHDLERAARGAMLHPGIVSVAKCGISYRLETKASLPCLVCRLLNGKHIHYMNAKVIPGRVDRWGRPVWTYWAYRKGQWHEIEPYGGLLTENAVQGLARELLVEAMFRLEEQGFPVVLTVHDEILVEHPNITKETLEKIMSVRPQWAEQLGVPVKAKAWVGKRYRK
jgi:DNA polymerase